MNRKNLFFVSCCGILSLLFVIDIVVFKLDPDATVSLWVQCYMGGSDESLFALLAATMAGVAINAKYRWGSGSAYGLPQWLCAIGSFTCLMFILLDGGAYALREGNCLSYRVCGEAAGFVRSAIAGLGLGIMLHHWFAFGSTRPKPKRS